MPGENNDGVKMKYPNLNVFVAWFLIIETLARGWVAAVGRIVLELGGMETELEGIPGQVVGALLLLILMLIVRRFIGEFPPLGKPEGNGYGFGHKLVLIANVAAGLLFIFPFTYQFLQNRDVIMVVSKVVVALGYLSIGMSAVGFSLIYQSSLPVEANKH